MTKSGMSHYQPDAENAQPPALPKKPSSIPRFMGVVHLVFGGLSLVSAVIGLFKGGTLAETLQTEMGAMEGAGAISFSASSLELLSGVDQANGWLLWLDLLVCVAMVAAGIGLVKYKKWGRSISNVYVSGSLLVKVLHGYIILVLAKPFLEAFVAENENFSVVGVGGIQGLLVAFVVIGGLYAVITLFIVNMKSSRLSLH